MAFLAQSCGRFLTLIVLIFAVLSLGFGHKSGPAEMTPEMAAYVAAGGSIFDLCGGNGLPQDGQTMDCEACRIADNLVTLQACDPAGFVELGQVQAWRFVAKQLSESQGLDPARLTRAPPYV